MRNCSYQGVSYNLIVCSLEILALDSPFTCNRLCFPDRRTDSPIFRPGAAGKIGGAQQGSGYRESRKKWWRKEFRELSGITKYMHVLQGKGDSRKTTRQKKNMEKRKETKKGNLCSNFKRIIKMETCRVISYQIMVLCDRLPPWLLGMGGHLRSG